MHSTTSRARASFACSRGSPASSPCWRGEQGSRADVRVRSRSVRGGHAQVYVKPNRELQNLGSFEVTRSREELAHDVGRFTAASTIAELALRFAGEEASHALYDTVADVSIGLRARRRSARSRWPRRLLAYRLGAWLHPGAFQLRAVSHTAARRRRGDVFPCIWWYCVSSRAASSRPEGERSPRPARGPSAIGWRARSPLLSSEPEARSHQRLLREFLGAHLSDDRPLRAFAVWEHERWSAA